MWYLKERGIYLSVGSDPKGNVTMGLSWRPKLVGVDELRKAVEFAQRYIHEQPGFKKRSTPLRGLIKQFSNNAKAIKLDERKQSALVRYESGEATFEQLLCEEALTPEVQKEYKELISNYRQSPSSRNPSLKIIRILRKKVYDRVRLWLINIDQTPEVKRNPPWWSEVLPDP